MKIVVASKRHYTGRDLIDDRYGRLFEIPESWVHQGHEVWGIALSYRAGPERIARPAQVEWQCLSALPFDPWGARRYLAALERLIGRVQPDVVWASSDAWHAIAAQRVCSRLGVPLVIDLYDNYESFGLTRVPGVAESFRKACRLADGLSVGSGVLADFVSSQYGIAARTIEVVGNAVDKSVFFRRDPAMSRSALGLPVEARIIGTAGALDRSRGIEDLLKAFDLLSQRDQSLYLALAGRRDSSVRRYQHGRLLDLGLLAPERVPQFWSALDLAVICNRDSEFGRYCHPQKLGEIVACECPFVGADVGELKQLCRDAPSVLYEPGSAQSLAERIAVNLQRAQPTDLIASEWSERATRLLEFFGRILQLGAGARISP